MSSVTIRLGSSDIVGASDYGSMITDYLETNPSRLCELAGATARLWNNTELADQFDNAFNALSVASIPADAYSVYAGTVECAQVACTHGFASMELADAGRKWGRSVCSLTSDGYSTMKFLEAGGIRSAFTEQLAPVAPLCDVFVYASDVFDNVLVVANGDGSTESRDAVRELRQRYWWQNLWELAKNGIFLAGAIASVIGVVFSAVALFAISLATMVVSMVAFFAKQDVREYSVTQGLQNIYENFRRR